MSKVASNINKRTHKDTLCIEDKKTINNKTFLFEMKLSN